MQRLMTSTAIVFASALLFTGCAPGSTDDNDDDAAAPSDCQSAVQEVRDVSNGAQNAIAAMAQEELVEYLDSLAERVDALEDAATDEDFKAELEALSERIDEAGDWAEELDPDPEAERDADEVAELQGSIQEAAANAREACSTE